MKILEYIGVTLAVVAYLLLVTGNLLDGFTVGAIASGFLAGYFITIASPASVSLQIFFIGANIYGMFNL